MWVVAGFFSWFCWAQANICGGGGGEVVQRNVEKEQHAHCLGWRGQNVVVVESYNSMLKVGDWERGREATPRWGMFPIHSIISRRP